MNTNEANVNASVLVAKVAARRDECEAHFKAEQEHFIDVARENPRFAIERSEPMLLAQYEYETWTRLNSRLANYSAADLLVDLEEDLMCGIGSGCSTNQFSNIADACKLKAMRNVYRCFRSFIEKYA